MMVLKLGVLPPRIPYYLSEEKRMKIKKILEANNIKVSSMLPAPGGGPGANPASPIEEERKWTVQHYKDVIDLASEWGAPTIIYVAGWVIYGTSRKDAWKYSLESLIEIAEYAKSKI